MIGLFEWASRLLGMPDIWTVYQFDHAVAFLGNTIEALLTETTGPPHHRPRYTLEDLLRDRPPGILSFVEYSSRIRGAVRVRKARR